MKKSLALVVAIAMMMSILPVFSLTAAASGSVVFGGIEYDIISDDNLISNGGFESGLSGWTFGAAKTVEARVTATSVSMKANSNYAHSGTYSLASGSVIPHNNVRRFVTVNPDSMYYVSFWTYTTATNDLSATVFATVVNPQTGYEPVSSDSNYGEFVSATGSLVGSDANAKTTVTSEWTKHEYVLTTLSDTDKFMFATATLPNNVFIDDVYLVEIKESASYAKFTEACEIWEAEYNGRFGGPVSGDLDLIDSITLVENSGTVSVVWSSSDERVIANNGKYTAPALDTAVTMTATITVGELSKAYTYRYTSMSVLSAAWAALEGEMLEDGSAISGDIDLVKDIPGYDDVSVSWYAKPAGIIDTGSGAFTAPASNTKVLLTAVLSYGGEVYTGSFGYSAAGESVDPVDADALLLYYDFEEADGTTVPDKSGNGNNGTLNGASITNDADAGSVLEVNYGATSHLRMPAGLTSKMENFTVATYMKINSNHQFAWGWNFSDTDGGAGADSGMYMFMSPYCSKGNYRFCISSGGYSSREQNVEVDPITTTGKWFYSVVTFETVSGGYKATVYLDNVALGENIITINPTIIANDTFNVIGDSSYEGDPNLDARFDEFRLYNRALTQDEIIALYDATAPTKAYPIYIRFVDEDGKDLIDPEMTYAASGGAYTFNVEDDLATRTVGGKEYRLLESQSTTRIAALGNSNVISLVYTASGISGIEEVYVKTLPNTQPALPETVSVSLGSATESVAVTWDAIDENDLAVYDGATFTVGGTLGGYGNSVTATVEVLKAVASSIETPQEYSTISGKVPSFPDSADVTFIDKDGHTEVHAVAYDWSGITADTTRTYDIHFIPEIGQSVSMTLDVTEGLEVSNALVADMTVQADSDNTNDGNTGKAYNSELRATGTGGDYPTGADRYALMRYDLSNIAGKDVLYSEMSVYYVNKGNQGSPLFTVYAVANDDDTWNSSSTGNSCAAMIANATVCATYQSDFSQNDANGWGSIDVGDRLYFDVTDAVKNAVSSGYDSISLFIVADACANNFVHSSENSANAAKLSTTVSAKDASVTFMYIDEDWNEIKPSETVGYKEGETIPFDAEKAAVIEKDGKYYYHSFDLGGTYTSEEDVYTVANGTNEIIYTFAQKNIIGFEPTGIVKVAAGYAPQLPAAVTANYDDGTRESVAVDWGTFLSEQWVAGETHTFEGVVAYTALRPTVTVKVYYSIDEEYWTSQGFSVIDGYVAIGENKFANPSFEGSGDGSSDGWYGVNTDSTPRALPDNWKLDNANASDGTFSIYTSLSGGGLSDGAIVGYAPLNGGSTAPGKVYYLSYDWYTDNGQMTTTNGLGASDKSVIVIEDCGGTGNTGTSSVTCNLSGFPTNQWNHLGWVLTADDAARYAIVYQRWLSSGTRFDNFRLYELLVVDGKPVTVDPSVPSVKVEMKYVGGSRDGEIYDAYVDATLGGFGFSPEKEYVNNIVVAEGIAEGIDDLDFENVNAGTVTVVFTELEDVAISGAIGEELITVHYMNTTGVDVGANIIVAIYDAEGTLLDVFTTDQVVLENGRAGDGEIEVPYTPGGATYKVFAWSSRTGMQPVCEGAIAR